MRFQVGCFLFACSIVAAASPILAPSSADLHKLYGNPVIEWRNRDGNPDSESFILRPSIRLTVLYGTDHHACLITLEPAQPLNHEDQYHYMTSERVSEILEEVAPADKRGEKIINGPAGVFCAGSSGVSFQNYANVYIRHDIRCGEGPNSEKQVRVNFKREVCPKFEY